MTAIIEALTRAVMIATERGPAPSRTTQLAAAELLSRRGSRRRGELAIVWWVPDAADRVEYAVHLYLDIDNAGEQHGAVVAAECACGFGELADAHARSSRGACSHLLAALALAQLDGYEITTTTTEEKER